MCMHARKRPPSCVSSTPLARNSPSRRCGVSCALAISKNTRLVSGCWTVKPGICASPRALARGLAQIPGFTVQQPDTNLVFFDMASAQLTPQRLLGELRARGVLLTQLGGRFRACMHIDVTAAMVDEVLTLTRQIVREAS